MAASYISLDTERSQEAARYARDLRNRMEATRTNLRIYQQQLDIYVKSMEKRFNFSFNDTVPLKALELQEKRMREIADLFDRAAELAKQYEREFGKYEFEIERYYDHCLCCRVLEHITRRPQGIIID